MPAKKQKSFVPSIKSVKSPSKRRIIVGLFVIAILGGVALVLRSFAATSPITLVSTVDSQTLRAYSYSGKYCNHTSTYDSGWKFNVAALGCQSSQAFDFAAVYGKTYNLASYRTPGRWKVCAWVAGVSKRVGLAISDGSKLLIREDKPVFNNSQYQYLCTTNTIRITTAWPNKGVYGYADVSSNSGAASLVRIASVNLVRVSD